MTPEPHHDNHELLAARIGITASSATAQSQVNRITTGTSKVNYPEEVWPFPYEPRCPRLELCTWTLARSPKVLKHSGHLLETAVLSSSFSIEKD